MDRTLYEEFAEDLKNGSPRTRLSAVKGLAERGGREACELLVWAMEDDDDEVRFHAALGLRSAPAKVQKKIVALFAHRKWLVREAASKLLTELPEPPVATLVDALRKREEPNVTFWSIRTLGEIGDPRAAPALVEVLRDGSSEEKIAATAALSRIEGRKSAKFLVEALTDEGWHVRKAAADALVAMGPSIIPELARAMDAENRDLFHWALKILATIKDPAAVDPLLSLLSRTRDSDRRESIVRALGELGGERPVAALLDLLHDESWTMRKCAAEALSRMGETALPAAAARYGDGNADVRYWVVRIAGEVASMQGAMVVRAALDDREWFVRSCAAAAAARIADPDALERLLALLSDGNPEVRKNAQQAIERIPAAEAIPRLAALRGSDDPELALAAQELLDRLADEG